MEVKEDRYGSRGNDFQIAPDVCDRMILQASDTDCFTGGVTYLYSDIRKVEASRYMGAMPMLTVVLKNGEQHSFVGMLFDPAIVSDTINSYRMKAA